MNPNVRKGSIIRGITHNDLWQVVNMDGGLGYPIVQALGNPFDDLFTYKRYHLTWDYKVEVF